MKTLNKLIEVPLLLITIKTVLKNLSTQRAFLTKNVQPILVDAEKHNDGSLGKADYKKINEYYGLAVPAILGEAFCALHNKKMNEAERISATAQGAMTGLFDDFFDKEYLSDDLIETLLHGKRVTNQRSNEKLFLVFYTMALQQAPDQKKMLHKLLEVNKAQLESKKQTESTITKEQIEKITYYKGGTSLLFYRGAFSPVPSAAEEKLIYDLGSLMQLSNDIFDVYKDREHGIKTLITEAQHIAQVRKLLEQQLSMCYRNAYNIGLAKKYIRKFLAILSIGIFSRAFVCLDQLEENEKSTDNQFCVQSYTRKQLICDMDSRRNKWKSAKYHIRLMREGSQ